MGPDKFQNITTLLFDLDNTLINSKAADQIACDKVFHYLLTEGVRRSIARDAVDKFRSSLPLPDPDDTRLILHQMRGALGPARSRSAPRAAEIFRETRSRHLKLIPGLEDLLLVLRGRYKLGLVAQPRAREEIENVALGPFFDAVVIGPPGRDVFDEAFRKLDVAAMECAMVCSSMKKSYCGVTVLVDHLGATGTNEQDAGVSCDFVIRELGQLPDLLPERKGFSSLCQDRRLGFFHSLRDEGWTSVG